MTDLCRRCGLCCLLVTTPDEWNEWTRFLDWLEIPLTDDTLYVCPFLTWGSLATCLIYEDKPMCREWTGKDAEIKTCPYNKIGETVDA